MIVETDEQTEILKQGEDANQKAIDSYNNYDLKDIKSVDDFSSESINKKSSKSIDNDSLKTHCEEDSDSHFNSKDSTEDHGNFISNDDEYFKVAQKVKVVPTMITASRENDDDDDGCVHKEFAGHDGATSEVYEEYKETCFVQDEMWFDDYNDYTYDACEMY